MYSEPAPTPVVCIISVSLPVDHLTVRSAWRTLFGLSNREREREREFTLKSEEKSLSFALYANDFKYVTLFLNFANDTL